MFAALLRFFGFSLLGISLLAISLIFVILALLIRILPRLLPFLRQGLRMFLLLSFRLYKVILERIAPCVFRSFGVDILNGHWRLAMCILLSLALGLFIPLFSKSPINGWLMGLTALHGLLVAMIWDDVENPEGIHLGARIL